jgi:hypothetical protein
LTFLHRSNCWSVHFSAIFAGAAFVTGYYILNLSASIVGALPDYGNLSSGNDLSALNECTFVADRNIKLWHITAVILILI